MPMAPQHSLEEVFEGKGTAIHVADEGIALTRAGVVPGPPEEYVATYDEVQKVAVGGGYRSSLAISFAGGRAQWVIQGMSAPHAQWAKASIDRHAQRAQRRTQPLFTKHLKQAEAQTQVQALLAESPPDIPDVVHAILVQAILRAASDVHFIPGRNELAVRWRVDGIVTPLLSVPAETGRRMLARLKVLAGLVSYEHDTVQEGRCSLDAESPVELRFTLMPSLHGETVTVRIFDPERGIIPLLDLGLEEDDLDAYRRVISGTEGMVVLTGPAGAGKTTTMYASMQALHDDTAGARTVATVEDPVEFDLGFASQTQITPERGLSFASALSTTLRQDPNVIMVGEIRDPETAEIAVRAGLTGHLIFTTLHAAGPGGVFPRLAEMDVAPFLATSAVRCIVAQRLLRRVCKCAREEEPEADLLAAAGAAGEDTADWRLVSSGGCDLCDGTGYTGRVGIVQVTVVDDGLRELAMQGAPAQTIDAHIAGLGVPSLREQALKKARQGLTTLEEVVRVLGPA